MLNDVNLATVSHRATLYPLHGQTSPALPGQPGNADGQALSAIDGEEEEEDTV
jgi:hypothetical protein